MSGAMKKSIVVAVIHVAIVSSLGAKLLADRATRPRVWARAAPVDPNLPIRGRYVSLRLEAGFGEGLDSSAQQQREVAPAVHDGHLVIVRAPGSNLRARAIVRAGERVAVLDQPVAYFIPEHATDPSRLAPGEELWVEVTIPRRGAPRPIRLGVKRGGPIVPLDVR